MQWKQMTPWYMESDSQYRISIAGPSSPLRYAAWEPGTKIGDGKRAIAYTETLEQAQQACERHAKGEQK